MSEHIQQMLFDFALERGYIEKLLEMKYLLSYMTMFIAMIITLLLR